MPIFLSTKTRKQTGKHRKKGEEIDQESFI